MSQAPSPSRFVPEHFDPADFAHIEPLLGELLQRPLSSPAELRQWVYDLSTLYEEIDEYGSRRNIEYACHTDDPEREQAFMHFVREIQPRLQPLFFKLQHKYLASPFHRELTGEGFPVMGKEWQADVDIYRDENVPLQTRATELASEYGKIMGAMTVEFHGQTRTLQQMGRFLEETDRPTREEAWQLVAQRRLADRQKLDELFEKLLDVRHQVAVNAGFENFRGYIWLARKRFDYTPQDCQRFGDAIARLCGPLVKALDEQRRSELGLEALRPWDLSVDVKGRAPLRPFGEQDMDRFVEGVRDMFQRVSPALASQFYSLKEHGDLDLVSRRGKRPGGFQSSLEKCRRPFIFMNAAGVHGDVDTLLHEGGHAFHYLAACEEPNIFVRSAPLEFCEVASMSMELLGGAHYGVFYDEAQAQRARRQHLEGIIRFLPWMATIDGFQHWLYTHPDHTRDQRTRAWLDMLARFSSPVVDWSGFEASREAMWHRQGHLFQAPFYYIEYGIAQLGSLQVWLNYKRDAGRALEALLGAFALGGSRPLPNLFEAAGASFRFDEATLKPLIDAISEELAKLPA